MDFNEVQLEKALNFTEVRFEGSSMDSREEHPQNVAILIKVTPEGIAMNLREEHP